MSNAKGEMSVKSGLVLYFKSKNTMAKRIVTKIGDVFCVEIDNEYKCFFQYVANDRAWLNSSVIRVFKKHYPMDYVPEIEEIVQDEEHFCAHIILRVGIEDGTWYKVGKSANLGEPDKIMFRLFDEGDFSRMTRSFRWFVWQINCESKNIGLLRKRYRHYNLGWVFIPEDIVSKIKTDKFAIRELK